MTQSNQNRRARILSNLLLLLSAPVRLVRATAAGLFGFAAITLIGIGLTFSALGVWTSPPRFRKRYEEAWKSLFGFLAQ
jgi:hypothetical protein